MTAEQDNKVLCIYGLFVYSIYRIMLIK